MELGRRGFKDEEKEKILELDEREVASGYKSQLNRAVPVGE